jgi:hypothetical protein
MKNNKLSGILWMFGSACFLFLIIMNLIEKKYTTAIAFSVVCLLYIINAILNLRKKKTTKR